jgi:hypothetical protein
LPIYIIFVGWQVLDMEYAREHVPELIDLSMALEGPSFFFFIRPVLSAAAASITIGLDLHRRRLLLHEVIGPGIMVCVMFDHYNFHIYASGSLHF